MGQDQGAVTGWNWVFTVEKPILLERTKAGSTLDPIRATFKGL